MRFRPSYSATSLNCPGSLLPSLDAPDKSGVEAAVGTLFHRLIAEWQLTGERPDYTLDQEFVIDGHPVRVDHEMYQYAEECLNRYSALPGLCYTEVKVDISGLTPLAEQTGTADRVHVAPGTVDIVDWKYGKGVQVFAHWNTQLLCYAWGVFQQYDADYQIETIRLHIAQPRLNHFDLWELDRTQLLEWAQWAKAQWTLAWQPDAVRVPSAKACQWCRIRLDCPARQAVLEAIVDDTFEGEVRVPGDDQRVVAATPPAPPVPPAPATLSTERLAQIYQYRRTMELWFKDIHDELIKRGLEGHGLGGLWKIVEGRPGNRAWRDEGHTAPALIRLGVDPWPKKLATPAEIERRLHGVGVRGKTAKEYLSLHTERAPGKPTLVPTQDNRLALSEVVDTTLESNDV